MSSFDVYFKNNIIESDKSFKTKIEILTKFINDFDNIFKDIIIEIKNDNFLKECIYNIDKDIDNFSSTKKENINILNKYINNPNDFIITNLLGEDLCVLDLQIEVYFKEIKDDFSYCDDDLEQNDSNDDYYITDDDLENAKCELCSIIEDVLNKYDKNNDSECYIYNPE